MRFTPHTVLKAVLDTNVIISGLHPAAHSPPAAILDAWRSHEFILVTSTSILDEVQEVLLRPSILRFLRFSRKDVGQVINMMEKRAVMTAGAFTIEVVVKDPDDDKFLAAAVESEADYLVTGDEKHLLPLKQYNATKIVTPTIFLKALQKTG